MLQDMGYGIYNMDAITFLNHTPKVKCLIADPPDNIGLKYAGYDDRKPAADYFDWIELLIRKSLLKCDVFWLSMYHKNAIETAYRIKCIMTQFSSWKVRTVIWRYTFGQYVDHDMPNGYRPIFLFESHFAGLNWDSIRVPSVRMEMGDERAAGPKIPDDVWEFPRVVGNHRDRCSWHPTQHPTELYARILRLSVMHYQKAVDLFGGTGTIYRAAHDLGMPDVAQYVDIDKSYCERVFGHEKLRRSVI